MEINNIYNQDCLEAMKLLPDNSIDLIFTDPPYALGSDVIILPNGKPEYEKARDFMSKWEQPNGAFWEEWFKEAKRILKHGGHCLVFGLDRQLMLYKYYACFAGLTEKQSLYWYFISNFPKASDLSKNLDKNAGAKRVSVTNPKAKKQTSSKNNATFDKKGVSEIQPNAVTPLAKKYEGYKYSIAPLKQTNETIMIFQKPYKTGSCLHDTLAMENGDTEITCGALDIEGNRIGTEGRTMKVGTKDNKSVSAYGNGLSGGVIQYIEGGRFPAQTFCDTETAKVLDEQSGIDNRKDQRSYKVGTKSNWLGDEKGFLKPNYNDIAGCSKSIHVCKYEAGDYDIYNYCSKVSPKERGEGNNHPTVKPQKLIQKILSLFKTPNEQIVLDCFAGSGTIPIACKKLNMNWIAYELNQEYYEIAKKRIKHTIKPLF